MNGFEAFQVRSWLDGALLILSEHVQVVRRTVKRTSAGVVLSACTVAASSAIAASSDASAKATFVAGPYGLSDRSALRSGDQVPAGYWPRLVSSMSAWQVAASDDEELSSLEPLI